MLNLYLKIRGRIHGPYDQSKLQSMIRKGQLSRVHQVSQDMQNWCKAGEYPELFSSSLRGAGVHTQQDGTTETGYQEAAGTSPQDDQQEWFYGQGTNPLGPVAASHIRELASIGQLNPDSLVWKEGMPDWMPLRNFPELQAGPSHQPYGHQGHMAFSGQSPDGYQGDFVRPTSHTVFGVINCILGALSLAGIYNLVQIINDPLGIYEFLGNDFFIWSIVTNILNMATGLCLLVFAIGLLSRKTWGRIGTIFYAYYTIIMTIVSPIIVAITASEIQDLNDGSAPFFWGALIIGSLISLVHSVLILIFVRKPN